ncbi:MAG: Crp/Fnr family transcriptional regulator [Brumimicrobium sp.]|nr:Crp/Fnr family transcriptional regulator [Brumimicrobium sp.]
MRALEYFRSFFESSLLEEIKENSKEVSVRAGDVILDYGEIVRNIPLIASGVVKVLRRDEEGNELLLYYVNAKESCAMTFTCCMEQMPSEIRAIAEEDVELLSIPTACMDQWLMKYPSWKRFVMRTIKNRFNELLHTIDEIAFHKLDERLKNYLLQRAKITGSKLLNVSHEEIASDMATSRVVISRLLKKLENDKRLLLYRNQIKLLSNFEDETQ